MLATETTKILLVEDNPGDAYLMTEALQDAGEGTFALDPVNKLSLALKKLDGNGIDLILLDLGLPDSMGIETFHKARKHAEDIPIIILTGMEDDTAAVKAVRDGAQDFLVKGQVDNRTLIRTIRYAIERKRLLNEQQQNLEYLQQLVETLPVAARVVQNDVIIYANQAYATLFGLESPEKIFATDAYSMFEEEDRAHLQEYAASHAAGDTSFPNPFVARARKFCGVVFTAEITYSTILYQGQPATLTVIVNLDEKKRLRLYESILPTCSMCSKVRDDTGAEPGKGRWQTLQDYVLTYFQTNLSHTFCPDCLREYRRQQGLPPEDSEK